MYGLGGGIVAKHENILPFFYGMMFSDFATTLPHKGEDCQFRKAFRNLLLSLCTPSPSLRWSACHRDSPLTAVGHSCLLFFLDSSQDIHPALNDGGVRSTVAKISAPSVIASETSRGQGTCSLRGV